MASPGTLGCFEKKRLYDGANMGRDVPVRGYQAEAVLALNQTVKEGQVLKCWRAAENCFGRLRCRFLFARELPWRQQKCQFGLPDIVGVLYPWREQPWNQESDAWLFKEWDHGKLVVAPGVLGPCVTIVQCALFK